MPAGALLKWFNEKGFGFIKPDDGSADCFTHLRQLTNNDVLPHEGVRVTFEVETNRNVTKPKTSSWTITSDRGGGGYDARSTNVSSMGYNSGNQTGGMHDMQALNSFQQLSNTMQPSQTGAQQMGTLMKWSAEKGFGFIQPDDGSDSFFAHVRQLTNGKAEHVMEGFRVSYMLEMNQRQQKLQASTWSVLNQSGGVPGMVPEHGGGAWPSSDMQTGFRADGGYNTDGMLIASTLPCNEYDALTDQMQLEPNGPIPPGPVMPPPIAPSAMTTIEVQVPAKYVQDIIGPGAAGLDEIKQRAGGDVRIEFSGGATEQAQVKVIGSEVRANLGACLVLNRVCELV